MIVTSHGRPGHLKRALAVGVRGFLPKTTSALTLAEVVRTVHAGGGHVDPELAAEAIAAGDRAQLPVDGGRRARRRQPPRGRRDRPADGLDQLTAARL